MKTSHYKKLENLFADAAINDFYRPSISISEREAIITIAVDPKFFHSGKTVHGSVYFKLLDDACYFACQSLETEKFLVTSSFNIQYIAPVSAGIITATATVTANKKNVFFAAGEIHDFKDRLVASGNGTFMPSRLGLGEDVGYR